MFVNNFKRILSKIEDELKDKPLKMRNTNGFSKKNILNVLDINKKCTFAPNLNTSLIVFYGDFKQVGIINSVSMDVFVSFGSNC